MILKQSDERRGDLANLTELASRCDVALKRRLDSEYRKLNAGIRGEVPDDVAIVKWDQFGEWWERQSADLSALSIMKMSAGALWEKRDTAWLRELGEKLCQAHTPIVFDWEVRLGLERADAANKQRRNVYPLLADHNTPSPVQVSQDPLRLDLSPMMTSHGSITFTALGDTEVAVRNPPVEPLIEIVRGTVKGRGRWQPRFRNWIVKVEDYDEVRCQIEARLAEARDQRRA